MRYLAAGMLIFMLGRLQYRLIRALLEWVPMQAASAWALHFILGTLWTHALHRKFTFARMPQLGYRASLTRTCAAYSILLALSTLSMFLICDMCGWHPVSGWMVTTLGLSLLNFLVMRRWSICNPLKDFK